MIATDHIPVSSSVAGHHRMNTKATRWIIAAGAVLMVVGCDSSPSEPDPVVERVEIPIDEPRLFGTGQTLQLRARAFDASGIAFTPDAVTWKVSDATVLGISDAGLVTSLDLGSALVSATVEGVIGVKHIDVVPRYLLPFASGTSHEIIQAFGGSFSHTGTWHYSYDFVMPIGTEILAARSGTVAHVEESFQDWDNEIGHENYVVIDHGDGTFARHLHLTQDGALVEVGQSVAAGDTIALSGNTGFSTLPHLHFDVTVDCGLPLPDCRTVEYWFANADPSQPPAGTIILAE